MSIVFSKNKKKRSRSTSSEANSSFVKNVASRVSGLLPVTITKWFSSPSSSNTNGSAPTADTTDSSTEDETTDSPVTIQPPTKRMRYSSPISLDHYVTSENNPVNVIEKNESPNKYSSIQSPPGRATFGRETNFSSTPLRTPNEEVLIERRERESNFIKPQHTLSSNYSANTKRSSLFCNESMSSSSASLKTTGNSNTIIDPKQPCFKPNLLGSPFYPGRTVYGGATSSYINKPNIVQRKETIVNEMSSSDNTISHSAKRVMDLLEQYSSPLAEAKRIQHYIINSLNDSSNSRTDSPSSNSKSFSYKTQELQVPSIASILRLKQRSRLMNTTSVARQIIASHSSSSDASPYPSSHTQRLQNEADVNQNLTTKIKSRLTRPKRGESSEVQDQPAMVNFPSAALDIDKTNLPQFHFGTPPVTDSISKSTLASSISKASSSTKVTVSAKSSSSEGFLRIRDSKTINNIMEKNNSSKQESMSNSDMFKFASPVRITNDSSTESSPLSKFTFGSPERCIEQKRTNIHPDYDSSSSVIQPVFESKKNKMTKSWKCDSCWVSNNEDADTCVCCSSKKPVPNNSAPVDTAKASKKCSICKITDSQSHVDKCINCEKVNFTSKNTTLGKTTPQSNWTCQDCWVKNDDTAEKCVCCGSKKPTVISDSSKDKPKIMTINTSSEWKCDICWIKNKNDLENCAACGTNKPKSTTEPSNNSKHLNRLASESNILPNSNKKQADKWECPSCLVRNDNDKSKCVCCDTGKPGTVTESEKKLYNFGVNQNTTFKFGIDPKVQESVTSKKLENEALKDTITTSELSETNNNVLSKTPTFAFGIPMKKSDDQTDASKVKIKGNEVSTPSFSFGIPKAMPALMTSPVTHTPNKLAETKLKSDTKENLQEVPKITVSPKLNNPFPAAKTFESPFSNKTDEIVSSPSFTLQSSSNAENKETSSNSQQEVISPVTNVETTPVTFKVSVPETKLSSNFFSSSAPRTVSSTPFTSSVQKTPVTTTPFQNSLPSATTSSLFQNSLQTTTTSMPFQNSLPKTISGGSIFQKSDAPISIISPLFTKTSTTNTTSVLPTTASITAPLFSFGNASQSGQPQADKPKFNFSFSTNKTESLPFKSNFGASDNNISSITPKFNLSTANPLGTGASVAPSNLLSGNGLSGNTLPAPASQPTTSILGEGNALSNNPLVANNSLSTGKSLQAGTVPQATPSAGIFGGSAQKDMWTPNTNNTNSSNLFVTNASANTLAKPATFTFGSSTPFNNNAAPTFGGNAQSSNVFGMPNQNSLFSSPPPNQPMGTMFGTVTNNAPVPTNLFSSPNAAPAPPATFGTPSGTFESPLPAAPTPASSFSFGAPQNTGVFGFGQQPPQQGGVYGVAGSPMNFNMGSHPGSHASSVNGRRMKRAVRRQR